MAPNAPADPLAGYAREISSLIHELRTPIGSIVGAASSLDHYSGKLDAETTSQLCTGIIEEAQRLDRLLTSFSVIAKAREGALAADRSELELHELLRGMARIIAETYPANPVGVSAEPDEIVLSSDPALIRMAVFSMLDLAVRFVPRGENVALSARSVAGTTTLGVEGPVQPGTEVRLGRIVAAAAAPGGSGDGVSADLVFVAALREVVTILGGRFAVSFPEPDGRLFLSLQLSEQ